MRKVRLGQVRLVFEREAVGQIRLGVWLRYIDWVGEAGDQVRIG